MLLIPGAAAAQSQTTAGADIYGNGGYSTRAAGLAAGEATGYVFGGVRPEVEIRSNRMTIGLDGEAQFYKYFKNSKVDQNYLAHANLANQFSAGTSGTLEFRFTDRILNRFGNLSGDSTATDGGDAALLGSRTRRQVIFLNGGLTSRLSERNSLSVTAFWEDSNYQSATTVGNPSNLNSYGGSLGFERQTTEHVKLGVQAHYLHSLFDDPRIPESQAIGGAGTFDIIFDPRWTLKGALGGTYRDLTAQLPNTPSEDDFLFTGNVSLCYKTERTNLCVHGSRAVGASGASGSALEGNLGGSFSTRLSEHGTLNADVSYFRSSKSTTNANDRQYVSATLGYAHRLAERLYLSSSTFYRKSISDTNAQGDDYGVEAGLKYRIGVLQ